MKHAAMEQNAATCALNDSGLDQVSGGGSIGDTKAEAAARYDNAMSAATTQLIMGIASGAAAATSAVSGFTPSGKRR
jgi:hypothetical protein